MKMPLLPLMCLRSAHVTRVHARVSLGFLIAFLVYLLPPTLSAQIQTLYVVPSSHWDRGFITGPKEIPAMVKPHVDEVIDNAERDPDFRWTFESIWQLQSWLSRTHDPARVQELHDLIKRGQIEITACYGSMHTEFMGAEELDLLTRSAFRMARRLGVAPPDLAMMDDVPGFTERLPQVLAASHVRYFLNGSNLFIGGSTGLAPGNVPFYWEGPDGSRVLTWVSKGKNGGYTEGLADYYLAPAARDYYHHSLFIPKDLQGKPPLEIMQVGVNKLLSRYQRAGYKYDAVLVMLMHDFIGPSIEENDLLPLVRKWNASGKKPAIRVVIPSVFFAHMVARYGSKLPTYRGDWSGLWSEVKTNSPGISSLARQLQAMLEATSLLWAGDWFETGMSFPTGNFRHDYRSLWNYDEHSGAGQTGWPDLMTVKQVNAQNQEYVDYVRNALEDQRFIAQAGVKSAFLQGGNHPVANLLSSSGLDGSRWLEVFEPLSWHGTYVIHVPTVMASHHRLCLEQEGSQTIFPVQWGASGGIAVVPLQPLGFTAFRATTCPTSSAPPQKSSGGVVLQNRFYRLELNASDGSIVHLIDRQAGLDLVNTAAPDGFNQLAEFKGLTRAAQPSVTVTFQTIHGPVYDSIRVLRPGTVEPLTDYRLFHGIKRLVINDELDSTWMPVIRKDGKGQTYDFAFPFFPGAVIRTVQYEDGNGMVSLPQDYLPGARIDAAVSHGIALSSGSYHVVLSSAQAFFWRFPANVLKTGNLRDNEVLSEAWTHSDAGQTRDFGYYLFPTVEPGLPQQHQFIYSLTSWRGPERNGQAFRKIWQSVSFSITRTCRKPGSCSSTLWNQSLFSVDNPNVIILAAAPALARKNAIMLRLQEISGLPQRFRLSLPVTGLEATEVNLDGTPAGSEKISIEDNKLDLSIGASATISLMFSRPD